MQSEEEKEERNEEEATTSILQTKTILVIRGKAHNALDLHIGAVCCAPLFRILLQEQKFNHSPDLEKISKTKQGTRAAMQ